MSSSSDGGIEGTLVIHVIDVAHEFGMQPADLAHPEVVRQQAQRIGEVLRPRILLRSNHRLSLTWTGAELSRTIRRSSSPTGFLRAARCGHHRHESVSLRPDSSDVHQYLRGEGAPAAQFIFNARSDEHSYYLGTTQGAIEVMKTFIPSGITTSRSARITSCF